MCELQSKVKIMLILMIPVCVYTEITSADQNVVCKIEVNNIINNEIAISNRTNITGRYTITWCPINLNFTEGLHVHWVLDVGINSSSIGDKDCPNMESKLQHSAFERYGIDLKENCSEYCLTKTLDLMYTGCYLIENYYNGKWQGSTKHYIKNNYTKEHYNNYSVSRSHNVNATYSSQDLSFDLDSNNNVPLTDFKVEVKNLNNPNIDLKFVYSSSEPNGEDKDKFNCKVKSNFTVSCKLYEALNETWEVILKHEAPWVAGVYVNVLDDNLRAPHNTTFTYEADALVSTPVSVGGAWRAWAGGAAGGALVGLALLLTRGRRRGKSLPRSESESEKQTMCPPVPPVVVLLYEKDHPLFMSAMTSLSTYIRERGLTVIDFHCPFTIAEMSHRRIGESWTVREWVSRYGHDPHVYFLIVPSLATAATLPPDLSQRRFPKDAGPGSTALFEIISWLRLQTDFPTTRYLVAHIDICDSPVVIPDPVPLLSPLVRVRLPGGVEALVRELGPLPASHSLHSEVAAPLADYVEAVRRNPHYLDDYLMGG